MRLRLRRRLRESENGTTRLFVFALLFMFGLVPLVPSASCAAGYPDHPIQLIVPNVAGALMDINGRLVAEELGNILGQKVVVMNKPGAGTVLGTEAALRSKKDGYTLLYASAAAFVSAPASTPEVVRYDPARDAEYLGVHVFMPSVVGVKADAPWKTLPEFVDYAKKNPGKIRMTSIGVGSTTHFCIEVFQSITGTRVTHVPFEGGETVITAVLGGHVESTMDSFSKLKPHAEAGRMRILMISPKRAASPEIPTLAELGYKGSLPSTWFGMFAPAGMPEDVKKVLVPAVEKAIKNTKAKVEQLGGTLDYKSPADMRKQRDDEYKQIYEIAVALGLRKP
jgi:tripartite-type tricarboxylate transporter receptor subunit TctC